MNAPQLKRTFGLWDLVLFNTTAIVGLRWLSSAARTGPYSLTLWILAMLLFFIPQGLVVIALAKRFPEEGGIYDWTKRAFGPFHGFFCGWCYWVSNLSYIPSLLLSGVAAGVFVAGPDWQWLAKDPAVASGIALMMLAVAVTVNVVGTEKGKWLENLGGVAIWIPGALVVAAGAWFLMKYGSATRFDAASLVPRMEFGTFSFWAAQAFAFAGLELAPVMAGEIRDPQRNIPRAIFISGAVIALIYILGTAAVMVVIPNASVDVINGPVQALDVVTRREGATWLPGAVGLLIALASVGGAGAWLAGSSRLPFVAGLDRYLPPAFASVHPRWRTPHVAIFTQAGLAAGLLILGMPGGTVAEAYILLQEMTILLYFVPFLYMFCTVIKLRMSHAAPAIGALTTFVVLILALFPPSDSLRPGLYFAKLIGGAGFFFGLGILLYWRAKRQSTDYADSAD